MREMSGIDRAAFTYLDNRDARETTRKQGTDDFISMGLIDDGPQAFRRFQESQFEDTVRRHRKLKERRGELHLQQINLWKIDNEGEKVNYFKACGELNTTEAAQHVKYWDSKVSESQEKRQIYYEFHRSRHGKKLDRMLSFMETAAIAG